MQIELTQRAQIALDHLPPPEQKRVQELMVLLADFPNSPALKGNYHELTSALVPHTYIARAGVDYRVLFRHFGNTITILEIAHHNRLDSFFRSLRGGEQ